jgi:hypothetical protein
MRCAAASSGASKIEIPVLIGPSVGPTKMIVPSASSLVNRSKCADHTARSSSVIVAAKFSRGGCRK